MDKVNAELVTLTYGTMVVQLCKDFDGDYGEVNKQLDKMGYNIGLRLIDDFLAKSNAGRCSNFRETAEMISKVGVLASERRRQTEPWPGGVQDLPQRHADHRQLDERQQAVLVGL